MYSELRSLQGAIAEAVLYLLGLSQFQQNALTLPSQSLQKLFQIDSFMFWGVAGDGAEGRCEASVPLLLRYGILVVLGKGYISQGNYITN
jgi:hypothetical protein